MALDVGGSILRQAIVGVIDEQIRNARTVVLGKIGAVVRQALGEVDVDFDAGIGTRKGSEEQADGTVPNAPVAYPGGGGFTMRWPLLPQDEVVAVCSDRNTERWRTTKLVGQAHSRDRHHHLSDAVVLPLRLTPPTPTPPATVTNEATDFVIQGPLGDIMRLAPTGPVTIRKGPDGATLATIAIDVAGTISLTVPTGQTVKLGSAAATLGVARLTDTTTADTTMTIWMTGVQSVCTAAAAFLGIPAPVFPSDFGIITQASTKVLAE